MINNNSNEVTLIIYDTPSPPKCIKVKKPLIKTFIFLVSFIVLTMTGITLYITSNLKALEAQTSRAQPKMINKLKIQLAEATSQIDQLKSYNEELSFKVSQGAPTIGIGSSVFKVPLGYTDKSEQQLAKTNNVNYEVKNGFAELKYDLINNGESQTKLFGYIFVVQMNGSSVQFYPENVLSTKDYLLKFDAGESFVTSRFRPVVAKFKVFDSTEEIIYKTFVFSRTGDLILEKVFGPFKAE